MHKSSNNDKHKNIYPYGTFFLTFFRPKKEVNKKHLVIVKIFTQMSFPRGNNDWVSLSCENSIGKCFIFHMCSTFLEFFASRRRKFYQTFSVSHFSPHSRVIEFGSDAFQLEVIKNKLITKKSFINNEMKEISGRFMIYFHLARNNKKIIYIGTDVNPIIYWTSSDLVNKHSFPATFS